MLMKRIINGVLMASILTAGLAGCNREPASKQAPVDDGDKVAVSLKLFPESTNSTGTTTTRATGDTNAIQGEANLNTATIFIYDDAGHYLDKIELVSSDFTQTTTTGADVWEATDENKLKLSTGKRIFLAGVNLPADAIASLTSGATLSTASTAVQTIARAAITTLPSSGIPMFSTGEVSATIQDDKTKNKITIPVSRIVAKVTVEANPNTMQKDGPGTIGTLMWTINNQNSKYFLRQGNPSPYADPNWTAASYVKDDFADATAESDWKNVADASSTPIPIATYEALYALENTSDQKLQKELTRVTVRATFIPDEWSQWNDSNKSLSRAESDKTTVVTFYTVVATQGGDTEYFNDQTQAQQYANYKGVQANYPKTFTNGLVYWNAFLNKTRRGEVIRNDYYKLNITRIVAPGNSSANLTNPETPAPSQTSMTVDVNILNWNPVAMDDTELIP